MELDCLETVIGIRDKRETLVVHGTGGNLAVACQLGGWDWSEGDVRSKMGDRSRGGILWL
jgi:hypothetical protein